MNLPIDQRQLYTDLIGKLDALDDETALIHYVGGVLKSLLRRAGDAEFLRKVQDAFTAGLAGRDIDERRDLAREVIGLVIAKRPEVALAWQKLNNVEPHPLARRAADMGEDVAVDLDDLPEFSLTPEDEDPVEMDPNDPYAAARAVALDDLLAILDRRLSLFAVPESGSPSPLYNHEHPFFVLAPQFRELLHRFFTRFMAGPARAELELEVFALLPATASASTDTLRTALIEARPKVWSVLINQLGNLANLQRNAHAKLNAAEGGPPMPAEYREVKVKVEIPRVIHVLGLSFTVGTKPGLKTKKVAVKGSHALSPDEAEAMDWATRLNDMAGRTGVLLPEACDVTVLRALLQFDAEALSQMLPELREMAARQDDSSHPVIERLLELDAIFPPAIIEALAVVLFHYGARGSFGFEDLLHFAMAPSPRLPRRLLMHEIGRRPRELAFQIRDSLRARMARNPLGITVIMLSEVWRLMDDDRFKAEKQAALTVFSAFPVAFAGDPDEGVMNDIGAILLKAFSAPEIEPGAVVENILKPYTPVYERSR